MSNNLVPANLQIPAHLQGRIGQPSVLAGAIVGGIGGAAFPRISIKGGRFRIVEDGVETVIGTEIEAVIVGANPRLSKTFYLKQWSPDAEPEAPDCQSLDGIAPDPQSPAIQNDLCATCPQNAWGSKINQITGKDQKACADQKRLAIVAADDPEGPIYLLQITPAALKGLNQYQKELSVRGIPPEFIKTRLTFDTDASFPLVQFGFGGFLDAQQQEAVDKLFGSQPVMEITGEAMPPLATVSAPVAAAPAPAKQVAVAKPAAKAEPVVVPPPAVVEEPAAPRRGFGAAKPAAKPKAAAKQVATNGAVVSQGATAAQAKPAAVATPAASASALSLADEIAALVGEVSADDA